MAKSDYEIAVLFAAQSAEGTYNAVLDPLTGTLSGDIDGTDHGLLLGSPTGIGESGLSLGLAREGGEKAPVGGFTTALSDFLRLTVPTFTFAFPMVGSKRTTTATPVSTDFTPLVGVQAIFEAVGWFGEADPPTWVQYPSTPVQPPISALIYINGTRIELLDCRCSSLSIDYTAGQVPVATATIAVGSVKDVSAGTIVSTDYAKQLSIANPVVQTVNNIWDVAKGFSSATFAITPSIDDVGDANQVDGIVKEFSEIVTTFEATLYIDSTDRDFEFQQLEALLESELDDLIFTVGTAATGSDVAEAHRLQINDPEVLSVTPTTLGSKAANTVTMRARSSTADSEAEIDWL